MNSINNQYENQPDMRKKVKEYIGELNTEIDRLENLLKNTDNPYDLQIKGRLNTIIEVKNCFKRKDMILWLS